MPPSPKKTQEEEKKVDEWSSRMWKLADDYDVKGLDEAMWKRREELEIPSGKPLWIQLPNVGF